MRYVSWATLSLGPGALVLVGEKIVAVLTCLSARCCVGVCVGVCVCVGVGVCV